MHLTSRLDGLDSMEMDVRPIFIAFTCITIWGIFVLLMAFRKLRVFPGALEWMLGYLLYGSGVLLMALRGFIPDAFSIFLANALLLMAPACLTVSMKRFSGKERGNYAILIAGAFSGLIFAVVALAGDLKDRIIAFALLHGMLWIPFLVIVMRTRLDYRASRVLMGIGALLFIVFSWIRIIPSLAGPVTEKDFFTVSGLFGISVVSMLSLPMLLLGGYLLLILERLIEDRQSLVAELEETEKARDRFVSIVSHDIGGPLAAVQMGLHVVNEELEIGHKRMSDAELRDVLSMLKSSIERVLSLQQGLIELYRMQRKQTRYSIESADVASLLSPVVEFYRKEMLERSIQFNLDMPAGFSSIHCDVNSMRVVLRSLISNAVRFTQNGGSISVRVYEWESWIVIRIFNSGSTIRRETIEQIRTGMKVVPMRSVTGESGSGMGLLLAYEHIKGNRAVLEIQNVTDGVECMVRLRSRPA